MRGTLLMTRQYVLKLFLIIKEFVVNRHYRAPGIAENGISPFFHQTPEDGLGTSDGLNAIITPRELFIFYLCLHLTVISILIKS